MRRNLLFYLSCLLWLIWIFYPPFWNISVATTLIYFLITWSKEEKKSKKGELKR